LAAEFLEAYADELHDQPSNDYELPAEWSEGECVDVAIELWDVEKFPDPPIDPRTVNDSHLALFLAKQLLALADQQQGVTA
jgi:hypothetical protein